MTTRTIQPATAPTAATDPFDLDQPEAYGAWRALKLGGYPRALDALLVRIDELGRLSDAECRAITERCASANFAIYESRRAAESPKSAVARLGRQLGLLTLDRNLCADEDSITSLQVMDNGVHRHYIPYTNRALNWHTDGYYNAADSLIRAFIIHCERDAVSGGENELIDPEIVYILLRDQNPEYIRALSDAAAMTIPANMVEGEQLRQPRTGPVFSVDKTTGTLYMRYTARTRSIEWKNDAITRRALGVLSEVLHSDLAYKFRIRLAPGQGIVCNNVLHNRSAFADTHDHRRLIYRARYHERVAGTGLARPRLGIVE